MRLLVFGKTGQVATELTRRLPRNMDADFLGRDRADLTDPAACAEAIRKAKVDAVINAAGWTAVDLAEKEAVAATTVNGEAPGAMARACADLELPFLHISTDYVFDGTGNRAFTPHDPTAPINAYGRSKLAGEEAVRASGARSLILRTSWIVSAHRTNFVKTMLRLGTECESLKVVADQIGGPTPAAAIADALLVAARAMINGDTGGTHHFAGSPDTSWAGFAREIMSGAGLACRIDEISTSDYPTTARRPLNSRLDCSAFTQQFDVPRPDWRAGLVDILSDLGAPHEQA